MNYEALLKGILEIIHYKVWVWVDTVYFKSSTINFDVNLPLRTLRIFFPGSRFIMLNYDAPVFLIIYSFSFFFYIQ